MALTTKVKNETINVGDTIRVDLKITEEDKTRTQSFEGVVISIKGAGSGKSFTVRKIASSGIGVERIWPVASPNITKVKRTKLGKVRRSKLYYLRDRKGKQATKIKEQKQESRGSESQAARKKG